MGRVLEVVGTNVRVSLDDREITPARDDQHHAHLGFAISMHRAQGSQWPVVIVPVFSSRIPVRSLIYTAVTRAQERVSA